MNDSTKKKIGIGAAIAAGAAAIGAAIFGKKKNRDKAKKAIDDAKNRTVSVTKKARKKTTRSRPAKKARKTTTKAKQAAKKADLTDLPGVGKATAAELRKQGIMTVDQLAKKTPTELSEVKGLGRSSAQKAIRAARRRTK